MAKIVAKLSEATGESPETVIKLLKALAATAYEEAAEGFVLPGFGKFQVVQPPPRIGTNPFSGKPVEFKAPAEVEFTVNTKAKVAFIEGKRPAPVRVTGKAPSQVLPEVKLTPERRDLKAASIDKKQLAERSIKLGGDPDWIQHPQTPVCCGDTMRFYGQLDSLSSEFCIGDMGKTYVFHCQTCSATQAISQW